MEIDHEEVKKRAEEDARGSWRPFRWRWLLLFPSSSLNYFYFEVFPMKFGDEEQEISPFWEDYYREGLV